MGIFNALAAVIVGWMGVNKGAKLAEAWFEQGMSIFGTAFVAFFGIFGAAGLGALKLGYSPLASLMFALFSGSGAMAAAVLALWKHSALTRGIPILAPMQVEKQVLEGSFALTEPAKTTGGKP